MRRRRDSWSIIAVPTDSRFVLAAGDTEPTSLGSEAWLRCSLERMRCLPGKGGVPLRGGKRRRRQADRGRAHEAILATYAAPRVHGRWEQRPNHQGLDARRRQPVRPGCRRPEHSTKRPPTRVRWTPNEMNGEGDTDARLWHPWLRINRVLRVMLHTRWSAEAWAEVRVEFRRAVALRSEIRRAG